MDKNKYVCYEGQGKIWHYGLFMCRPRTDGGYNYEGLFYDGIFGMSFAPDSYVFEKKLEAVAFVNEKNNL